MQINRKIRCLSILALYLLILAGCNRVAFRSRWLNQKAPESFTARFYTSKGMIEAEFFRAWSPKAVDRLYAQFRHHYYDHILFYRVHKGFVAQFGGDDSLRLHQWNRIKVPDEPVLTGNTRGTISFARSGKDSRDNDLFINLADNHRLDTISYGGVTGFPALGRITKGMEAADSLYDGYGDKIFKQYDTLFSNKTTFLRLYPKLDSLIRVTIIRTSKRE